MSGHRERAEELLAEALVDRTGSDVESSRQFQALVHATLALVERQEIANLIAFRASLSESEYDLAGRVDVRIREGLGL